MLCPPSGYYERCIKFYRKLGVELEEVPFDYAFSKLQSAPQAREPAVRLRGHGFTQCSECTEREKPIISRTSFIYNGGNGLSLRPFSIPKLVERRVVSSLSPRLRALRHTASYLSKVGYFAVCYIYLIGLAAYHYWLGHLEVNSNHWTVRSTLSQYTRATRLPTSFCAEILVPLFACVATCSPSELADYPVADLLLYILKTFGAKHYVVKDGVTTAVQRLTAAIPKDQLHLGCELSSIKPSLTETGKKILEDANGQQWTFDHVVFATQASQARPLLRTYHKALQDAPACDLATLRLQSQRLDALSMFQYTRSTVVNHYDSSSGCLPRHQWDRRMLNIATWVQHTESNDAPLPGEKVNDVMIMSRDHVMATHDVSISKPHLLSKEGYPLLQTTNPTVYISERRTISRKTFDRAIMTVDSKRALRNFLPDASAGSVTQGKLQGHDGVWFVGAWAAEVSHFRVACAQRTLIMHFLLLRVFRCWKDV